jgi:hypothetical protein
MDDSVAPSRNRRKRLTSVQGPETDVLAPLTEVCFAPGADIRVQAGATNSVRQRGLRQTLSDAVGIGLVLERQSIDVLLEEYFGLIA